MAKTATEFQHMVTFAELVTEEVFREIVTAAIDAARVGDAAAREWIGAYAMGAPKDVPCHLSGINLAERMQAACDETATGLFPVTKGRAKK